MIRPYFTGAVLALLLATGAWLYWQGKRAGELDRARDNLDTRQRIDNALDDSRPWLDRLVRPGQ